MFAQTKRVFSRAVLRFQSLFLCEQDYSIQGSGALS